VSRLETVPGRVLTAVGPLLLGAVLICVPAVLSNYGPHMFASRWFEIPYLPLRLGGAALAAFPAFGYRPLIVAIVMFFATGIGLFVFPAAIERAALRDRGIVTRCEVTAVHVRTWTDSENRTKTSYDHELQCADPRLTAITTRGAGARPEEQRDVRFDPTGRSDPHWATEATDPSALLWIGVAILAAALAHRLIGEFLLN
jgi:hypothetical protein